MGGLSRRRSENQEVQVEANLEDSEDRIEKVTKKVGSREIVSVDHVRWVTI